MILKPLIFIIIAVSIFCSSKIYSQPVQDNSLSFAGEPVPVDRKLVATNLVYMIRLSLMSKNYLNTLQIKAKRYFPYIQQMLKKYGIPDDFKYLPVIESGFVNATSHAGASGLWQFMPATATDYGLKVNEYQDERGSIFKSTQAACRHIKDLHHELGSWTLVALAYNFGLGNVRQTIRKQGKDYYSMRLNEESAQYLYRVLAVKELFTKPELYKKTIDQSLFINKPAAQQRDELKKTEIQLKESITDKEIGGKFAFNSFTAQEPNLSFKTVKAVLLPQQTIEPNGTVKFRLLEELWLSDTLLKEGWIGKGIVSFGKNLRIGLNILVPEIKGVSLIALDPKDLTEGIINSELRTRISLPRERDILISVKAH